MANGSRRWIRAARVGLVGGLFLGVTGCGIVEAPYVSFSEHVPFQLTLTDREPVAIRDLSVLHLLTLFQPSGSENLPITVDWTLDVRATSFDAKSLGSGTSITFETRERP